MRFDADESSGFERALLQGAARCYGVPHGAALLGGSPHCGAAQSCVAFVPSVVCCVTDVLLWCFCVRVFALLLFAIFYWRLPN